jgi:hypothetical protein
MKIRHRRSGRKQFAVMSVTATRPKNWQRDSLSVEEIRARNERARAMLYGVKNDNAAAENQTDRDS